ncbi:hypothetical protein B0A55_03610 [Friedmanniomyces simplex]|uniref:HMA domain-containing protein n=1 Tax=Friedmanniomyces simplex TaxID=329884 RepID=A0A4U0XYD6_9PEZI|nr:hypothetical protein B0A55_03610 [Friedmanniomyces simplex]
MAPSRAAHMTTTTLKVSGMTCGACTSSVEAGFSGVEGVGSVSVSLVMERAVVIHDAEKISAQQLRDIVEDRGFDAELLGSDRPGSPLFDVAEEEDEEEEGVETDEQILGSVEGAFKDVPGIKGFSISLLSERAVIEHDTNLITPETLAETIEDTGFDAEVLDTKAVQPLATKPKSRRKATGSKLVTTTVAIEGMTCGACTSAVESGFKDIEGLAQFNISLLAERAVILHDPSKLSTAQIAEIIEDRGFDATVLSSQEEGVQTSSTNTTVHLKIYGLPSPEAAADLQANLQNTPGIASASINFATTRASITHTPSQLGLRAIVEAVEKAGYNALVADSDDNNAQLESLAKTKEIQEWYRAFKTSLTFAIPVFLVSMVFPMFIPVLDIGSYNAYGIWLGDIICLALTIPVQFGIGRRFYVSAYKSLRHGSPTMDVLVVLGTSAAFFFSCAAMLVSFFTPPHSRPATTFDTSTMLITFILLGRFLENRAKGQTSKALSRLMSLAPSTAVIYSDAIAAAKAAEGWDAAQEQEGEKESSNEKASATSTAIEEKTVPTELLEVGDIVLLKPGDKIPADGLVTRGESYVDESMVTGEAMPILKKTGSTLMAGTVNGAGRVDFRVTRAGRDTQLSQIVRLVQEAQTSRAPIQRMADRVAGWFVPIIITLGVSTFIAWMALSHLVPPAHLPKIFLSEASGGKLMVCVKLCIAVIVFACPCALGLATPTAVMVGTGVGAEQGILVKGGATLETATRVRWVVMDKTGTLTRGKMSVSGAEIVGEWDGSQGMRRLWWGIVGLAEGGSEHPIARAVTAGAKSKLGVAVDGTLEGSVGDFKAVVGKGLEATVEPAGGLGRQRYHVVIGNASLLRSHGIEMPTTPQDENEELSRRNSHTLTAASHPKAGESAGITTIHIAIDKAYAGSLALSDTLKPSARACIAALHSMGITTSLVTGDQAATANHVASLVGIPAANVHSGVLPSGKRSIIEDLQRRGEIVAMVGDGINDSPALATAHVGISLASGTDVAMEAADIVLMKPEQLLDIPASLHLSRTIFRRIKYNLLLSCVYNAMGLPIAMGFLLPWGITLPPLAAGAAMACSSVTVVVSSLLLKFWKRPRWMVEGEEALLAAELGKGRRGSWVGGGQAVWSRVAGVKNAVLGRRRNLAERERGAYVPLESYEAV